jgi:aspartate-semialdehyde dehydrogenase
MVGRRFAELLGAHPWFEIGLLVGGEGSAGRSYEDVWEAKEAALEAHYGTWARRAYPAHLKGAQVGRFEDITTSGAKIVFSSVPENAGPRERFLLDHGLQVFSNSPYGRFDAQNPLIVPEVNRHALDDRPFVKNPNCVTSGLVLVLDPIRRRYGVEAVSITTYQSLSGRGDAKYARDLVIGNVLPLHGSGENTETYIGKEVKKILDQPLPISVSCSRVGVQEGHYVDVRIKTSQPIGTRDDVVALLRDYNPLTGSGLPSAPEAPLVVLDEVGRPRPSCDASHHDGMAVAIGNISTSDEVYDLRLTYVVNNLIRGAAGGAILNAEIAYLARA